MDKVIDVDFRVIWQSSACVRIGNGTRERVDGPDAALAALPRRWPSTSQSQDAIAKRRRVDAISQHGSTEHARGAFIEAAVAVKVIA
jgi:hypothetical protein